MQELRSSCKYLISPSALCALPECLLLACAYLLGKVPSLESACAGEWTGGNVGSWKSPAPAAWVFAQSSCHRLKAASVHADFSAPRSHPLCFLYFFGTTCIIDRPSLAKGWIKQVMSHWSVHFHRSRWNCTPASLSQMSTTGVPYPDALIC